jgi:hypothetical protein
MGYGPVSPATVNFVPAACKAFEIALDGGASVIRSVTPSKPQTEINPRRPNLLWSVTTTRRSPRDSTARANSASSRSKSITPLASTAPAEITEWATKKRAMNSSADGPKAAPLSGQLSASHINPVAVHRGQGSRNIG